jgi:integrase
VVLRHPGVDPLLRLRPAALQQPLAGLPRMRFHDLRHQAASLAIASGSGLREVMGMLGHSQIGITADLYSHLLPHVLRGVADRMDALLAPAELG